MGHPSSLWNESESDLALAVSLYKEGVRPLAYVSVLEDRPGPDSSSEESS